MKHILLSSAVGLTGLLVALIAGPVTAQAARTPAAAPDTQSCKNPYTIKAANGSGYSYYSGANALMVFTNDGNKTEYCNIAAGPSGWFNIWLDNSNRCVSLITNPNNEYFGDYAAVTDCDNDTSEFIEPNTGGGLTEIRVLYGEECMWAPPSAGGFSDDGACNSTNNGDRYSGPPV
jgi:hypothetical protein